MYTLYVPGKGNDIVDVPSRLFRLSHCWNTTSDHEFLSRFNQTFPLAHGAEWQLFKINPKLVSLVIGKFRQRPLSMDVWSQLPQIGRFFWKKWKEFVKPRGVDPYLHNVPFDTIIDEVGGFAGRVQ